MTEEQKRRQEIEESDRSFSHQIRDHLTDTDRKKAWRRRLWPVEDQSTEERDRNREETENDA